MARNPVEVMFVVSLICKAALALIQLGAGFALLILPTQAATGLINVLVKNELVEDPTDPIARLVERWVTSFDPQAAHFYEVYLLGHGALHTVVVLSLLLKWRIAYPFSLASLVAFVVYQLWHYAHAPSMMLLVLTAIDLFVIVIVVLEHNQSSKRLS